MAIFFSPVINPSDDSRNPIESKVAQLADQLSSIKLGSANSDSQLAHLQTEIHSIKKTFKQISEDVKDIQSMKNLYSDLNNVKLYFQDHILKIQSSIDQIRSVIDGCNSAIQQNASQIIDLSRSGFNSSREVSELSYAQFTGNPKETKQFVYFIKEKLFEKEDCFRSEKSKINWIVRHFRHPNGSLGDPCASYNWWMALLFENARQQKLPTESASVQDPYVLPQLLSASDFLAHLEDVFDNKHDNEDAKKKLNAFRQQNRTIEEFNALFNSLCFAVDLTEESRCDIYERALNPKILKIAVMRGDWKSTTTLKGKQSLAVSAAEAQDKIASIDSGSLPALQKRQHAQAPVRSVSAPPVRIPDGVVPMDLDVMSAENCFNFPRFRAICRKKQVCQRCHGQFDKRHVVSKGCPASKEKQPDVDVKIELYKRWISEGGKEVEDALAEVVSEERSKPAGTLNLDDIQPLSLGDMCWDEAASHMDVDREPWASASFIDISFVALL
ncbi:hypothetical protein PGT21_026196 [Puccinia graminis f. sp. tritici]|uniref:Retrotransposon gag domain-containing protein n=1 Tax=Puccinia graminis f. sp. tritici TaxID=56615 RepID=A0A5B0R3E8_PUCGR|nr:hypothetical protein PGT21_026196 [Puccinia graminis f. sp. tritici]